MREAFSASFLSSAVSTDFSPVSQHLVELFDKIVPLCSCEIVASLLVVSLEGSGLLAFELRQSAGVPVAKVVGQLLTEWLPFLGLQLACSAVRPSMATHAGRKEQEENQSSHGSRLRTVMR
jgi:hypothetical protein